MGKCLLCFHITYAWLFYFIKGLNSGLEKSRGHTGMTMGITCVAGGGRLRRRGRTGTQTQWLGVQPPPRPWMRETAVVWRLSAACSRVRRALRAPTWAVTTEA